MTTGAFLFMAGSWAFVLSLMSWSFWRILRGQRKGSSSAPGGSNERGTHAL